MSDFISEASSFNNGLISILFDFVSKNPEFSDYASYRLSYLLPLFVAIFRNKSNFRHIFLFNLGVGFTGIFVLDSILKTTGFFLYALLGFLIYFLPILIGLFKNKHNLRAIFICNLLFGFTAISWFVILIWAIASPETKPNKSIAKECKHCKELVRFPSTVCHHCHRDI